MKLLRGKILVNVRIPYAWRKILIAKAKKEKVTVNNIVCGMLKKKFGIGKRDESDLKMNDKGKTRKKTGSR